MAAPPLFAQDFKTVGYLPTYRFERIDQIKLEQITHLNIAFANPDAMGKLQTGGQSIAPIVSKAQSKGVKVYIALAGAGASAADWAYWIASGRRSSFVHGIMNYLREHQLDGVDVDLEWEVVNQDYSAFVLELRDSLKANNSGLSAALPGTHRYPEINAEALAAFDWVNLMAYDLTGPWAPENVGPHSPYSFAEQSIAYWKSQGLSSDKMALGVPFYGYDFTNVQNVGALTYAQIIALDPNNSQSDKAGEIYYNGQPTIARKTHLALDEDLGGIMVWELGQDHFGSYSLLNTIHETVAAFLSNPREEEPISKIQLFPNPTLDQVYLSAPNSYIREISIYSIHQELLQHHIVNGKEYGLSMKDFPAGIYIIMLQNHSGYQAIKLIKI